MAEPTFDDRLLGVTITLSSTAMRTLAVAHSRLGIIGAGSGAPIVRLTALLLSLPVFHAHSAVFRLCFAAQDARIRIWRGS